MDAIITEFPAEILLISILNFLPFAQILFFFSVIPSEFLLKKVANSS